MTEILKTIILGLVEGLTAFLPVSSTAHLIVTENLLGIQNSKFLNFFTVFVQLGAISAVPFLYFMRTSKCLNWFLLHFAKRKKEKRKTKAFI